MTILSSFIYVDNDSLISLRTLRTSDGTLITDATVDMIAFVDRNNNTVSGVSLPLQLNHVGNAVYEAVISKTIAVVLGKTYRATVRAVTTSGLTGTWVETAICTTRVA